MPDDFAEKAKMWDSNPKIITLANLFAAELDKIVPDPSGLAILEFGCGTGLIGLRYANKAASLDMNDTSPAMLDVLRAKDVARADTVRVHEGDIADQAIAPESIDWLFSNMALHHVEDIPALLTHLCRIVKPGGRMTIGDLETESGTFHAPGVVPHNGFDPQELAKVFEDAGFTVNMTYTFLTFPRKDQDDVSHEYSCFVLDATRTSAG